MAAVQAKSPCAATLGDSNAALAAAPGESFSSSADKTASSWCLTESIGGFYGRGVGRAPHGLRLRAFWGGIALGVRWLPTHSIHSGETRHEKNASVHDRCPVAALSLVWLPAQAQDAAKPAGKQQNKMAQCSADFKATGKDGKERQAFMKECLSNK